MWVFIRAGQGVLLGALLLSGCAAKKPTAYRIVNCTVTEATSEKLSCRCDGPVEQRLDAKTGEVILVCGAKKAMK